MTISSVLPGSISSAVPECGRSLRPENLYRAEEERRMMMILSDYNELEIQAEPEESRKTQELGNQTEDKAQEEEEEEKKKTESGKDHHKEAGIDQTGYSKEELRKLPLCRCCLCYGHGSGYCPYSWSVKEGARVGPGWAVVCKCCFKENTHPGEKVGRRAVEKRCGGCGLMGDHFFPECPYKHLLHKDSNFALCLAVDVNDLTPEHRQHYIRYMKGKI